MSRPLAVSDDRLGRAGVAAAVGVVARLGLLDDAAMVGPPG